VDRRPGAVLGGLDRGRGRAGAARAREGGPVMIGMEVLYGLGGLVAVLLLAYLVFALICAEEF